MMTLALIVLAAMAPVFLMMWFDDLEAAHDACLDGDHRACRDAITQLMCEIGPDGAVPEAKP